MHLAAAGREPGHPALSSCGHVGNSVDAFADGLGNLVDYRAPQGAYVEPGKVDFGCAVWRVIGVDEWLLLRVVPLGPAVTIEFVGPLLLAAVLSRSLRDATCVALALIGMALLGVDSLTGEPLNPRGALVLVSDPWLLFVALGTGVLASLSSALPQCVFHPHRPRAGVRCLLRLAPPIPGRDRAQAHGHCLGGVGIGRPNDGAGARAHHFAHNCTAPAPPPSPMALPPPAELTDGQAHLLEGLQVRVAALGHGTLEATDEVELTQGLIGWAMEHDLQGSHTR